MYVLVKIKIIWILKFVVDFLIAGGVGNSIYLTTNSIDADGDNGGM